MVFVPAENVLQVELRGSRGGKAVENVLYFARGDTIEDAEVTALFDWLEDVYIVQAVANQGNSFTWTEIYGTDLTTSISPTYSRSGAPIDTGESASPPLPNSDTLCVSFRSDNRGRSSRGRNYFPGMVESQVTGDNVELAVINAIVEDYELLLGGGTFPSGWDWVIISRFFEGVARLAALIQEIIDVLSTDIIVDTQRKRLR
jgi:hypothetical protein